MRVTIPTLLLIPLSKLVSAGAEFHCCYITALVSKYATKDKFLTDATALCKYAQLKSETDFKIYPLTGTADRYNSLCVTPNGAKSGTPKSAQSLTYVCHTKYTAADGSADGTKGATAGTCTG